MKLVIQTQYKENYAAFNDDYVIGVSEPYWKMKGGSCYIVDGLSAAQVQQDGFWEEVYSLIESSSDMSAEYIIFDQLFDDADFDITKHIEEWETPTYMYCTGGKWTAMKIADNRNMGSLRNEILEVTETWDVLPGGERENYKGEYLMEDVDIVLYKDLMEWFETKVAA